MANDALPHRELRIVSMVEALTVTGPLKPLLMFSSTLRNSAAEYPQLIQALITTRRDPHTHGSGQDELYTAAAAAGLECFRVPERGRFDPGVLPKMGRLIRERRPDIVETHDCKSHFLFWLLRSMYREARESRWIAFHHGYTRTSWQVRAYQLLDYLTLRRAHRVVTLCKPFGKYLVRRGVNASRLSIISNAVAGRPRPSKELISEYKRKLQLLPAQPLVITVGRLSQEKGQADLITALRELTKRDISPRLLIVGDGPDRRQLEALAEPIRNQVTFMGHIADPWVLFNAADVVVIPSHSEGSPLVMFEAMAAGTAIIATTVGGIPEVLENGVNALLIPSRNPAAMAAALADLLGDSPLRLRLGRAAMSALDAFSPDAYSRRLLAIYAAALDSHPSDARQH